MSELAVSVRFWKNHDEPSQFTLLNGTETETVTESPKPALLSGLGVTVTVAPATEVLLR